MLTAYPDEKLIKESDSLGAIVFVPKVSQYSDLNIALKAALNLAAKKLVKVSKEERMDKKRKSPIKTNTNKSSKPICNESYSSR